MAKVTANSQNWNFWDTGTSSALTLRKGFFHSPASAFSTAEDAAMPSPVNMIMGKAQILTT